MGDSKTLCNLLKVTERQDGLESGFKDIKPVFLLLCLSCPNPDTRTVPERDKYIPIKMCLYMVQAEIQVIAPLSDKLFMNITLSRSISIFAQ